MIPCRRAFVISAALSVVLSGTARGQDVPTADEGAEYVNYALDMVYADHGYASYSVGDQTTQVLSIPVSIWIRNLTKGRKLGIRLRLTGIIGFADFENVADFDFESVRLGALIPGVEFMLPLSETSMLRPYLDAGIGLNDAGVEDLWAFGVGLRTEFIFPWRKWELGLEPRAQFSTTRSSDGIANEDIAGITGKMDARYPLSFLIGGMTPDAGVYFQPGYYPEGLEFKTVTGQTDVIHWQFELGVTVGFRQPAPKIWLVRIPRLSVGYSFGDGLSGLRIKIGGDRATRLPEYAPDSAG